MRTDAWDYAAPGDVAVVKTAEERRLRLHERRSFAAQDPDVRVGRHLAEQRGDRARAGHAGDVHLHHVMDGLAPGPRGRDRLLIDAGELQLHEPRLRLC